MIWLNYLSRSTSTRGLDVFNLKSLVGRVGTVCLVPVGSGADALGLVELDIDVERLGGGLHHCVTRLSSCRGEEDSAEDVLITNISGSGSPYKSL